MNVRAALFTLILTATTAHAQGFAGMGQTADGFDLPDPDTRFSYPEDHGSHPGFRIEWWYVTATLTGDDGEPYGLQWTLFRNAARPGGRPDDQVWMGHAAVSTPDGHYASERLARGGIGQADVTLDDGFTAFIDEWQMTGPTLSDIQLTAGGTDFAYDIRLDAGSQPFVTQGADGFSVKSEDGLASHYYSQPFYIAEGTITLADRTVRVSGNGWLDREWSSQPLAPDQTGWDWISLHLDSGAKLMCYRLRRDDGSDYTVGTWITPDGVPQPLQPGDLSMVAAKIVDVDGRQVPVVWDVTLPRQDLAIRVAAIYEQSWMDTSVPYWEGPVTSTGSHPGKGYLEMTGYE